MKRFTYFCLLICGLLLSWSVAYSQTNVVPDDVEFQALKALYDSTAGPSWTSKTGWPTTWPATATATQMDAWFGITVTNGDITAIKITSNNMTGKLPAAIGNLTALTSLELTSNKLVGKIPDTITNLANLVTLTLRSNKFTTIPTNIKNLTKLKSLILDLNNLTGSFPDLTGMNELVTIDFGVNALSGPVHPSLGLLPKLNTVDCHINQLNGSLPHMENPLLTSLDLSNNKLTGGMPATSTLPNLLGINLAINKITTFPTAILSFSKVKTVYLYRNLITGALPDFGGLPDLTSVNMYDNSFTGTIAPSFGTLSGLVTLNLSVNQLTGTIPPSLGNLTNLTSLNLTDNKLSGPIPHELGALNSILTLSIGLNQLTGELPESLRELTTITYFHVGSNKLTGELPEWIGELTNLQSLYLYGNAFKGTVPTSLNNLSDLRTLYLNQNQLSGSLPSLAGMNYLENLYAGENYFSGGIPASWGALTNLKIVGVENNYLSGEFPTFVQNWTKLTSLKLNNNKFIGAFPSGIGSCTLLTQIKAEYNEFTSLPTSLLNIPVLTSLYFNSNKLTSIPDFRNYTNRANLTAYFQNNYLGFDTLELLYGATATVLKAVTISPQNYFDQVTKISVPLGANLDITAAPKGVHGTVVWEKLTPPATWTNITASSTDATRQRYIAANANQTLNGTYRWTVTSSKAPVTLQSRNIVVEVVDALNTGGSSILYNGMITSVRWRTDKAHDAGGEDLEGMYLYTYDNKYQIQDARFAKVTWADASHAYTTYELQGNQYRLTNMSYDPNGNIQTLNRFDKNASRIHNFNYNYYYEEPQVAGSEHVMDNRLKSISGHTNEYVYNEIGQLTEEDKATGEDQFVDYDVTGKVIAVYRDQGKTIKKVEYQYDDLGFRMAKIAYPETGSTAPPKTTWYIRDASGNVISIYEQDGAPSATNNNAVIQKEVPVYAAGKVGTYYPQQDGSTVYELTDHLGNVRALVRENVNIYTATMEDNQESDITNPRVQEMQYFQNLFETEDTRTAMNHTSNTATIVDDPTRSAQLFWQSGVDGMEAVDKAVGPAISLKVNGGDTVKLETYYRYEEKTSYNHSNFSMAVLSTALAGSFYQVDVFEGVSFPQTTQAFNTALTAGGFLGNDPDNTKPYAYLNYIVLDENRNRVVSDFKRVTDEGAFPANEETLLNQHAYLAFDEPIVIPPDGKYIYAWVSNESENIRVWFDDFRLTHTTTFVAEATDYGVWGDVLRTSSVDEKAKSIKENLQAQYLLNGNANDSGPRALNGTAVSGAVPTTDRNGVANQAYFFDGVNDNIDVPNTKDDFAYIHNNGVFSISLFIKLTELEARSSFVGNALSSVQKGFNFFYDNYTGYDHVLRFSIMHGVSGKFTDIVGRPRTINDLNWHHVAVVGDGQTIRLFVDGVEDGYATHIVAFASGDASAALVIGGTRHTTNPAPQILMHGSLDELNIFDKALSAAEVRLLANNATLGEVDETLQPEQRYRYQYQGQFAERDEETGWNHFELREYDPITGRWTTIDPYGQFWSPYRGMGNDPLNGIDPDGGLFGKMRAQLAAWLHGGEYGVDEKGNWYANWAEGDGDDISSYASATGNYGKSGLGFSYNDVKEKANDIGNAILYSDAWNSLAARWVIPDVITLDGSANAAFPIGGGMTWTLNIVMRGDDFGIHKTITATNRYGAEFDGGVNAGFLYFTGDPRDFKVDHMLGRSHNVSGGFGIGGTASWGTDGNGNVLTWGASTGIGATIGLSYGRGETVRKMGDYHLGPHF